MRYLLTLMIALLVPTAALAKGECKDDRKKFCVGMEKTELWACLKKHEAEVSAPCKSRLEARTKAKEERAKNNGEPEHQNPTPSNQPQTVCFDESCREK